MLWGIAPGARSPPEFPPSPWTLTTERAAAELIEARRLVGDDRYSTISRLRTLESLGVSKVRASVETTYFVGLRKAGVPED